MKSLIGLMFAVLMLVIAAGMVNANEIGFTVSQLHESVDWGLTTNLSGNVAGLDAELDVQAQGGEIIKGRYSLEVGYKALVAFQNGNIKGYTLDGLGNELDIGLKTQVNVGGLDVAFGVLGRNASEFASRTAYSVLVDENGFAEEGLPDGLADISPPPSGLKIHAGSNLNLLLSIGFKIADLDAELRVLPQLTGETKAHQALLLLQTDYQLTDNLKLNLGADIATQLVDETIEYETATVATVSLEF